MCRGTRQPFPQLPCGNYQLTYGVGECDSPDGPHLRIAVPDADGKVSGGHMGPGCVVRTTAEVLAALLPEMRFSREEDPATGFEEPVVKKV